MRVFLDDQPVTPPGATFAAALAEVRRLAEGKQRVIVEAVLDGLALPDAALTNPPDEEYPGAELRFATDEPVGLVQRTLAQVSGALDGARAEQARAAELIQTGALEPAMRSLASALETWGQVQQAVTGSVALLGLSIDRVRIQDQPLSAPVESLAARLAELKRALTDHDWPGLSDALAFDMADQADNWIRVLSELGEFVARAGAPRHPEPRQPSPPQPSPCKDP